MQTKQPVDSTDFASVFEKEYKQEFGFILNNAITVDDVRCRGTGKTYSTLPPSPLTEFEETTFKPVDVKFSSQSSTSVYFPSGRVDTPVFRLEDVRTLPLLSLISNGKANLSRLPPLQLKTGEQVEGPAMILDATQTIVICPGWTAFVTSTSLLIELSK